MTLEAPCSTMGKPGSLRLTSSRISKRSLGSPLNLNAPWLVPMPMAELTPHGYKIAEERLIGLPRIQPSCPAGSALFLDRFTPHRTLPTTDARFALVVWMKAA